MLAGASGPPRAGLARYLIEPKLDGQRIVATIAAGQVRLAGRRGTDATESYPELATLADGLAGHRRAVLDGEVVAFDRSGRPDFQTLQARMHVRQPSRQLVADVPVVFVAFDVLWLDGETLIALPQEERRHRLESLAVAGTHSQTVGLLAGETDDLLAACRQLGIEGFMAKRRDAPYLPGRRSTAWVKVKAVRRREFVVGGWTEGEGARARTVGSLGIGYVDDGIDPDNLRLRYVGQVGSGLSEGLVQQLLPVFERYARSDPPFVNPPAVPALHWVEPLLVVQVTFTERTRAGTLRHPVLSGVRTDVVAAEVGYDEELAMEPAPAGDQTEGPLAP